MGQYVITSPSGREYDVEANSPEEAAEGFAEWYNTELQQRHGDATGMARTGIGGIVEGVPIIGPPLRRGAEWAAAATRAAIDPERDTQDYMQAVDAMNREEKEANPGTDLAGQVTGAIGGTVAAGGTNVGANLLGMGEKQSLAAKIGMSSLSSTAITAADLKIREALGEEVDVPFGSGVAGVVGAASPVAGQVVGKLAGLGKRGFDTIRGALHPERAADIRIARATEADAGHMMTPEVEAAAKAGDVPVMNVDRGGEATRQLAREGSYANPEAAQNMGELAAQRFREQSDRMTNFFEKQTGGRIDDVQFVEGVRDAARAANSPAYKQAFGNEAAQNVMSDTLADMLDSPAVRKAIQAAEKKGADRKVLGEIEGEIRNPFKFNKDGTVSLVQGRQPTLAFWDQVKRNLDTQIAKAKGGDVSTLIQLKKMLNKELDRLVPIYEQTRGQAAEFFQTEDAVSAGAAFAKSSKKVSEYSAKLMALPKEERAAMKIGFVSELRDMLRHPSRRVDLVRKFDTPEWDDKFRLMFGPKEAKNITAYLKAEAAVANIKGSMSAGNVWKELAGMTAVGAGAGAITGDAKTGMSAAGIYAMGKAGGRMVDRLVMKSVMDKLTSGDPKLIEQAAKMAASKPGYMKALDKINEAFSNIPSGTARGLAIEAGREAGIEE